MIIHCKLFPHIIMDHNNPLLLIDCIHSGRSQSCWPSLDNQPDMQKQGRSWVCVRPVRKRHCWFSHDANKMICQIVARYMYLQDDFLEVDIQIRQTAMLSNLSRQDGKF